MEKKEGYNFCANTSPVEVRVAGSVQPLLSQFQL